MSEFTFSPNEPFMDDYWLPISAHPITSEQPRVDATAIHQINDLTALAMRHFIEGGETEPISPGNSLEHSNTNRWLIPGVVLLLDQERLIQRKQCNPKKPCHLKNEKYGDPLPVDELGVEPLELIRANTNPKNDKPNSPIIFKPYVKYICHADRSMHYRRHLRFYATAYNEANETVSAFSDLWVSAGVPMIQSELNFRSYRRNVGPALKLPTEIGATYKSDSSPTAANPVTRYSRISSAHVLMREFIRGNARANKGRRQFALRPMVSPARNF